MKNMQHYIGYKKEPHTNMKTVKYSHVCKLKLRRSCEMQQVTDPKLKNTLISATELFQRHKIHLFEWSTQSPDLNPTDIYKKNMSELKQP